MTLSVIIPAYNAEKSIRRCLESLLSDGVEVIVVDDGSSDGTADLVRSYQADYHQLRLISQTNRGVSAARNVGIEASRGDYLICVDADDYLIGGAIPSLVKALARADADIIVMRSFASGAERYPWMDLFSEDSIYDAESLMKAGYFRRSVCGCAFSHNLIREKSLSFQENLTHSEDVIFMSMALSSGARVSFRDICFYEVCVGNVLVDTKFFKRYSDALLAAETLIPNEAVRVETSLRLILGMTHAAIQSGVSPRQTYALCSMDRVLPLKLGHLSPRSRRMARLLNFNYPLFYFGKNLSERFKQPEQTIGKGPEPRVLFITYHYLTGAGGGIFASRGFINAMCEIYGSLTLLCPVKNGEQVQGLDSRVRIIPVAKDRPALRKILDIISGNIHYFRPVVQRLLREEHFDLVVFDNCNASARMFGIVRRAKLRSVTIHHNWQYAYEKDNTVWPQRPFRLFYVKRFEKKAVRCSDLNITLTSQDRESLYAAYGPDRSARIEVCPPFEYK